MRQSTSITGCVRWLVSRVTHSFDDPHVAPYWPTWPCFQSCYSFKMLFIKKVAKQVESRTNTFYIYTIPIAVSLPLSAFSFFLSLSLFVLRPRYSFLGLFTVLNLTRNPCFFSFPFFFISNPINIFFCSWHSFFYFSFLTLPIRTSNDHCFFVLNAIVHRINKITWKQDEKHQILMTNTWLKLVSDKSNQFLTFSLGMPRTFSTVYSIL